MSAQPTPTGNNVKKPPPPPPPASTVDVKKAPPKAPPKQSVTQVSADLPDNRSAINRILQSSEKKQAPTENEFKPSQKGSSPDRPLLPSSQAQNQPELGKSAKKPPPPPKFSQSPAKDSQRLDPPQVGPMASNSIIPTSNQSATLMTRRPPPPNPPPTDSIKVQKRVSTIPGPPSDIANDAIIEDPNQSYNVSLDKDPQSFINMTETKNQLATARRLKYDKLTNKEALNSSNTGLQQDEMAAQEFQVDSMGNSDANIIDSYTVLEMQQQLSQQPVDSFDIRKAVDDLGRVATEPFEYSEDILPDESAGQMGTLSLVEQEDLSNIFKAGRLYVKCKSATDVRPPRFENGEVDKSLNFFVKFILGSGQQALRKQSAVQYNCTLKPSFGEEIISFDVANPLKLVVEKDISLVIELWNKGTFDDGLIATVTMFTSRFFANPSQSTEMDVPMYTPSAIDRSMAGKLSLQFEFHEAKVGLIVATIFSASNLRDTEAGGQHDSYCKLKLAGSYEKRGKTLKDCGSNPEWREEEIVAWVDGVNWVDDLTIEVLDEDVGRDEVIGSIVVPILEYMTDDNHSATAQERFELQYTTGTEVKAAGILMARIAFLQAGRLTIHCVQGRNLRNANVLGQQDTVLSLTMVGIAARVIKKTLPHKDGGPNPVWNAELSFDIVDQYQVLIEAWDQDISNKDELLGYAELSLLQVFQKGHMSTWISLKSKNQFGVIVDAGEVQLEMEFQGPASVAFPQHRKNVQTFDDSERTLLKTSSDQIQIREADVLESKAEEKQSYTDQADGEFTNDQITAAFAYFDLDHNGFVGATELRHLLICMGELVTDEEIDMMICMVDTDGDGQVGLDEFRAIILHPDPSEPEFMREMQAKMDARNHHEAQLGNLQQKNTQAPVGGVDIQVIHRQRAVQLRESKKQALSKFCTENLTDFDRIKKFHARFLAINQQDRVKGVVEFQQFCSVLGIEMIGEYRDMFALFDEKQVQFIDLKLFLLGLLNFVQVDKEVRLAFIFSVYDEMRCGYILKPDLEEILMGNHFQTRDAISGKVSTVMKQSKKADTDGLTLSEFIVVAKKFPNIMFIASDSQSPTKQSKQRLVEGKPLSEGMFE